MITPETHDHALNCETTLGRGCDCGLTGMAAIACYSSGKPVYKTPVKRSVTVYVDGVKVEARITISPELTAGLAAGKDIKEVGERFYLSRSHAKFTFDAAHQEIMAEKQREAMDAVTQFLNPMRSTCVDGVDLRKVDSAQLLEMLKAVQAEIERREKQE